MDISPNEEQRLIGDTVRRFFDERGGAAVLSQGPLPSADWRALAQIGALAFMLAPAAGGLGSDNQDAMIISQELGRSLAVTPAIEAVVLAAALVAQHGSAAQRATWHAPVLEGKKTIIFAGNAVIEVGDDGWRIDGSFPLVRFGMGAAGYLVVQGKTAVIVPEEAPGIARTPVRLADGSIAASLVLDGVRLSADAGFALPAEALDDAFARARIALAAQLVGAMETLYEATIDHIRQRNQFGVPIASFQVIQHRAARLFVSLEQARSMALKAALIGEGGAEWRRVAMGAHAYVAHAALRLAQEATQMHGGMGVTEEHVVGRGHRIVLTLSQTLGGTVAARAALAGRSDA